MVGRICPPGCNRVKVSQNLGATAVAPVAPVDASLQGVGVSENLDATVVVTVTRVDTFLNCICLK